MADTKIPENNKAYDLVMETLGRVRKYRHAASVINYDLETICPPDGMEEQGETIAFLTSEAYKLLKDEAFIAACEELYAQRFGSGTAEKPGEDALPLPVRTLTEQMHREYLKNKNITPEKNHGWQIKLNKAYVDWINAKQENDFSKFAPSLTNVRDICLEKVALQDGKYDDAYDGMIADYEHGVTAVDLDRWFGRVKERLIPLMKEIRASGKTIRTDFMSRRVTDEQQRQATRYLLETIGYDFRRGAFTTTEHPFTDAVAKNDVRITTHFFPEMFTSNFFSTVHEGGHALFGQLLPPEDYDFFIEDAMTMGMHESASRFYENRIGRSEEFIEFIFPKMREIFPEALGDVTPRELYEAVNEVKAQPIRIEADEFTYTFHIIIRYEIERMLVAGRIGIDDLPRVWNDKYEEYLGIRPENDSDGVLQDVHWSFGFGYFPTYALGNMYNAMYFNRMRGEIDTDAAIRSGDISKINEWMKKHVFERAVHTTPKEWIREICGREFTPDDFLDYLEDKYRKLYEI